MPQYAMRQQNEFCCIHENIPHNPCTIQTMLLLAFLLNQLRILLAGHQHLAIKAYSWLYCCNLGNLQCVVNKNMNNHA